MDPIDGWMLGTGLISEGARETKGKANPDAGVFDLQQSHKTEMLRLT